MSRGRRGDPQAPGRHPGEPDNPDSTYRISVEGVRRFRGTVTVTVTDGRLAVTNGSGSVNNKLNYLDVIG